MNQSITESDTYYTPREQESINTLTEIKLTTRVKLLRFQQAKKAMEFTLKIMSAGQAELDMELSGNPIDQTLNKAQKPLRASLAAVEASIERCQYHIADTNSKIAELRRKAHLRAGRDEESFDKLDRAIKEFIAEFE